MASLTVNLEILKNVVCNSTYLDRVKFSSVAKWGKPYTLTCPKLPRGVSKVTVTNYSYNDNSSSETILTQTSTYSSKTATIYYYDDILVTAEASSGYSAPTIWPSSRKEVNGNITITITAGSPQGGGGGGDVVFHMDGTPVEYSCPSGTKWSTLDAVNVLGYRLYEAAGLVSPV